MAIIRLKQNEYNVGALAGKYALKDMSNTGKFSNIVEENPIKINFEIDGPSGTITLKQGSLLTVPYGFSEIDNKTPIFRYERVNADKTISVGHVINDYTTEATTDAKVYLIYNYDADELECDSRIAYRFVDENEYDADNRLLYAGNTFVRNDFRSKCALPFGYFDDAWHFHQFTALGFYKDRMWADSGFLYYVPRGRKEDYGLEVDAINIEEVVYTTVQELLAGTTSYADASGLLLMDLHGKAKLTTKYQSSVSPTGFDGYEYVSSQNYILSNYGRDIERLCKVCDVSIKNNLFHELKNYNTYQTVDFAEVTGRLSELNGLMLHNDGRAETVAGVFTFPHSADFSNITINGGKINAISLPGTISLTSAGKLSMDDADIKAVKSKAANPNCIGIVGKSNTNRGGIAFGTNGKVSLIGDENANTLTIGMDTGSILPKGNQTLNLGSTSQSFNTVYAKTFNGNATSSNWADLAEVYATDKEYPIGTLLQFGGKEELTIAHDEVNAVVSEKPGVLMNSEMEGQPVALAGRVRVRVKGEVKKFDKIYLSPEDGVGVNVGLLGERPIGRALESKVGDEEGLVLCAVHFNI